MRRSSCKLQTTANVHVRYSSDSIRKPPHRLIFNLLYFLNMTARSEDQQPSVNSKHQFSVARSFSLLTMPNSICAVKLKRRARDQNLDHTLKFFQKPPRLLYNHSRSVRRGLAPSTTTGHIESEGNSFTWLTALLFMFEPLFRPVNAHMSLSCVAAHTKQ